MVASLEDVLSRRKLWVCYKVAIKLVPCGQLLLVPLRELERWCDEHAHYLAGGV